MQNEESNDYYVYALVASPGEFRLSEVFYIGKGKGLRVLAHFQQAADVLRYSAKVDRIRQILGVNPSIEDIEKHAYVLIGNLSESDAFDVESLFIKMLGGPQGPQLLNIQGGHGKQETPLMVPLREAQVFFDAEELKVQRIDAAALKRLPDQPNRKLVVTVKGTHVAIDEPASVVTDRPGPIDNSIEVEDAETVRFLRGWSPQNPWTDDEAKERASVWWPLSLESIARIREMARTTGVEVALLVRDPRNGSSVVRYVWDLDPTKPWLHCGRRWGLPLSGLIEDHPWRGRKLLRDDSGKQVLAGHSSGIGNALRELSGSIV